MSAGPVVLVTGLVGLRQDGLESWFHTVRIVIILVQKLYPQLLYVLGCLSHGDVGPFLVSSEGFMAAACISFCT